MTERRAASAMRYLGALALLAVGIDHIEQYYADYYRAVPTIGTLFLLNFVSALVVGLALLAPLRRFAGRVAPRLFTVLALSGIGIAGGSLAALFISESSGLFGFMEVGYRGAIVLSIVLEATTVVLLAAFVAFSRSRKETTTCSTQGSGSPAARPRWRWSSRAAAAQAATGRRHRAPAPPRRPARR